MPKSDQLLARARAEFAEMPGLRLTRRQAERLFALDSDTCGGILEALVESGFLTRAGDGTYARSTAEARTSKAARLAMVGGGY